MPSIDNISRYPTVNSLIFLFDDVIWVRCIIPNNVNNSQQPITIIGIKSHELFTVFCFSKHDLNFIQLSVRFWMFTVTVPWHNVLKRYFFVTHVTSRYKGTKRSKNSNAWKLCHGMITINGQQTDGLLYIKIIKLSNFN